MIHASMGRLIAPLDTLQVVKPVEKASLASGTLAALGALLNSLVTLFNGWSEDRRLKISVVPNKFAERIVLGWSWWHSYIRSIGQPAMTDPAELLAKSIEGYGRAAWWVLVQSKKVASENYRSITTFKFTPVGGHWSRFRFKRSELLRPL